MPERIQRKRAKGWRMPAGAIYVGRPSKWGNPFVVGGSFRTITNQIVRIEDAAHAVRLFRPILWCRREQIVAELRGKDLACWCSPGMPCHADLLMDIANG